MGLPPAQLHADHCFSSTVEALQHRQLGGWITVVVEAPGGDACLRPYNAFEWIFALLLATLALLATVTSLCVAFISLRRLLRRCRKGTRVNEARRLEDAPSITAVIPCYLPNEQYIIEETVEWIMRQVESPGPLEVLVVYNTPKDLPDIEARLKELEVDGTWPEGRHFRAMRVQESKSKAANLNAALRTVKDAFVVIYDADHHPDSDSLLLLWEKMVRRGVDCVQGSYYMRNLSDNQFGCSPCAFPCLARIIDAEFFTDWFLMKLVTRTFFLGNGYFSGSNALWKTSVLASREFSETAQTEDVDMAIQQLLEGRNIEFCAESRSGELAPMGFFACWKQRLRWTMGWDETSLKHGGSFTDSGRLNCRARCGLVWTFLVRWFMTLLTVGAVWVGFPLTIFYPLKIPIWGKLITRLGQVCFFSGCGPWFFATLEAILQVKHRGRQSCIQVFFVFLVASPFGFASFFLFNLAQQAVSCYKISTGKVDGWEVTARGPAAGMGWADKREESGMILVEPDSSDGELADSSESDSETGSISG